MGNLDPGKPTPIKMLFMGNSGSGKTGALAALALAGYEVVIADFDNGLDVIREQAKVNPKVADNIYYQPFQDQFEGGALGFGPKGLPSAFTNFTVWMNNAKGNGYDFGPVTSWGPKRILVIDSLTHCCNAAMRWVLAMAGRSFKNPEIQDWGNAMNKIELLMATLYSDAVKCNVIINAHIDYITLEGTGMISGLPTSLGNKLSPKIPSYFNTLVYAKTVGSGPTTKRTIKTVSEGVIEAKCPASVVPGRLAEELPQATGLATIFQTLQGELPK